VLWYFADIQYMVKQDDIDAAIFEGQSRQVANKRAVVITIDPHMESMPHGAGLIQLVVNHAQLQQLISK